MSASITPGSYTMSDVDYFAAEGLSQSAAKLLLAAPGKYRWSLDHPEPFKESFNFGKAAHSIVLGAGPDIIEIPAGVLASNGAVSTKEAKAFRDAALAAGQVPLKAAEIATIDNMAAALQQDAEVLSLLSQAGEPEQALFWEVTSGVRAKAKLDLLPDARQGRDTILVDYKTAVSADPNEFRKNAGKYGYHRQAAWYSEAVREVRGDSSVRFIFVVQETEPPYTVQPIELDRLDVDLGMRQMHHAADIMRRCQEAGVWPNRYVPGVAAVSLPIYYTDQAEEALP